VLPRVNEEVNAHWICDAGRMSYVKEQEAPRLESAMVGGTASSYDAAIAAAAGKLKAAAQARKLGVVASPRTLSEDLYAWRALTATLGGATRAVRSLVAGDDDALLVRADKGANTKGAMWIFGSAADEDAVLAAAAKGDVATLLVLGDTLDPADTLAIPATLRGKLTVIYAGPFVSGAAEGAAVAIPTASWSEADGTYVNFEGRAQRVRRCHLPLHEARPGWRIATDLAEACGIPFPTWRSEADVLRTLAADIQEFAGVTPESMGLLGVAAPAPAGV